MVTSSPIRAATPMSQVLPTSTPGCVWACPPTTVRSPITIRSVRLPVEPGIGSDVGAPTEPCVRDAHICANSDTALKHGTGTQMGPLVNVAPRTNSDASISIGRPLRRSPPHTRPRRRRFASAPRFRPSRPLGPDRRPSCACRRVPPLARPFCRQSWPLRIRASGRFRAPPPDPGPPRRCWPPEKLERQGERTPADGCSEPSAPHLYSSAHRGRGCHPGPLAATDVALTRESLRERERRSGMGDAIVTSSYDIMPREHAAEAIG